VNKDGIIDADYPDRGGDYLYRERNVLIDGGVGLDLTVQKWSINIFATFRKVPFVESAIFNGNPGSMNNQSTMILDRWQKPGDQARFARYTTVPLNSDGLFSTLSDAIYSDGSYVRLRNVAITYDFDPQWAKKAMIRGCKIYLRGENLLVLTRYNGSDPDTPGLGALPPSKVFTAGIQFNF
jgi:hypothetical protein